uniref:Uncharacterized protein n=1 Tax=Nelumbo nucifera TaxID=4432 RepID=A0A822ZIP1_NELNU|nr:TPA_asm: hypothetical protein HUJ06_001731 [Nelumbo nucifera]
MDFFVVLHGMLSSFKQNYVLFICWEVLCNVLLDLAVFDINWCWF